MKSSHWRKYLHSHIHCSIIYSTHVQIEKKLFEFIDLYVCICIILNVVAINQNIVILDFIILNDSEIKRFTFATTQMNL